MASPMLYRMIIVCSMIEAIQAGPNTYWSKRSGEISQGPEVSTETEGYSNHPIEKKKTKGFLEEIGNIHFFLVQQLLTEKNLRGKSLLLANLENPVKFQLKWKETQSMDKRKKTKDLKIVRNIQSLLFPQILAEKKLREKKLLLKIKM